MSPSQPDPILRTKLFIPQVRPTIIRRERLVARLNEGAAGAMTLLSAPAGFGKTTLLAEWAAARQSPPAWLSLDADDNDPARFLSYAARALNAAGALSPEALARIDAAGGLPPQTILVMLLRELDSLDFHFFLVLDDYHAITARPVHQILSYLLDHLPLVMHLVIATRVDPPAAS